MDKDRIAGTAKEAKGSVNEAAGRWLAMPSYSLTARRSAPLQDLDAIVSMKETVREIVKV